MESCVSATELRHVSPEQLPELLDDLAQRIGALYYSLSRPHLRESHFDTFVVTNFPEDWQRAYVERRLFRTDPAFIEVLRSNLPVFREESTEGLDTATGEAVTQRRLLGCQSGMLVPVRGCSGRFTVLSFWSADEVALFRPRCEAHHDYVVARAPYLHELATRKVAGAYDNVVSKIELECLKWTSLGKTAWEISVLLNVPERTIHYHLAEASKKLGAPNKTGAVGVALRHGLLDM